MLIRNIQVHKNLMQVYKELKEEVLHIIVFVDIMNKNLGEEKITFFFGKEIT